MARDLFAGKLSSSSSHRRPACECFVVIMTEFLFLKAPVFCRDRETYRDSLRMCRGDRMTLIQAFHPQISLSLLNGSKTQNISAASSGSDRDSRSFCWNIDSNAVRNAPDRAHRT